MMENFECSVAGPSSNKRVRSANYSLDEKSYLLQLVGKYKHVIENKATDAVTNANKDQIWLEIAREFNAVAPSNIHRDMVSLKKAYLNIKKNVRKEVADEKIEIKKTGGGKNNIKMRNPLQEIALATMNEKTVFGLHNMFDGDHETEVENVPEEAEYIYITSDDTFPTNDVNEDEFIKKASDLNHPVDPVLKQKINNVLPRVPLEEVNKRTPISRRRPTATAVALHGNEVGKLYSQLCKEKLEIAAIEKKIASIPTRLSKNWKLKFFESN